MEKAGIDKIEELITAAANTVPTVDKPVAILPGSCSVVDMERYLEVPLSFSGTMHTSRIKSLVDYTEKNKTKGTALFVGENMTAKLIVDHGTSDYPEWGLHAAVLTMEKCSDYADLLRYNLEKLAQTSMIDFIRDHEHCLTFYHDAEMSSIMPFSKALLSIQKIDITNMLTTGQEENDFKQRRSTLEEVEVSSEIMPPALMVMTCQPYYEFPSVSIVSRVIVYMSKTNLSLAFRIQSLEKVKDDMTKEFSDILLSESVMSDVSSYIGSFKKNA